MKKTINLDMDGVLADFRTHFFNTFGIDDEAVGSKKVCEMLGECDDFFDGCPLLPGAQDFFYHAATRQRTDLVILTSAPVSCFDKAAAAKRRWIRKHFGGVPVIPVPGSRNKHVYLQHPGDLLIDDWGKNIEDWRNAGGFGIKHENDFGLTMEQFSSWMDSWSRK